jgi:hypothetical protein
MHDHLLMLLMMINFNLIATATSISDAFSPPEVDDLSQ